jgi:osmotically-inducible protein OsmY
MKTDSQIQRDVMEELNWDPSLNASEIGVAVKDGVVTLSGYVEVYAGKRAAENAAMRISGVKAVAEDIVVKQVAADKKNDTDIATAILNSLKWLSAINEEKIKIMVEDGWVVLNGEVEWNYQKDLIKSTIENIYGVTGITNLIKITSKTDPVDVKRKIKEAFHRSANIDANSIAVETKEHKVILNGIVRSYAEKRDAENAAWSLPGITMVENNLEIEIPSLVE